MNAAGLLSWFVALGITGQSADELRFHPMDIGSARDEQVNWWGIAALSESRLPSKIEVFVGTIYGLQLRWSNGPNVVGDLVQHRPSSGWRLEQLIADKAISRSSNLVASDGCASVTLETRQKQSAVDPTSAFFSSIQGADWPWAGSISDCPAEMLAIDELAGDLLLRTCARPKQRPREWDVGQPIDMIVVGARGTVVETIWVNRLDSGPSLPVASPASACGEANDLFAEPRHIRSESVELTWAEDGSLVTLESHVDEVREGLFFVFYRDATPAVFGTYRDGLMHGTWGWLNAQGTLVEASEYMLGVKIADLNLERD